MKKFIESRKEWLRALRVGWFLALRQIKRSNKGTTALIIFIMILTFLNLVVVSGLLLGLISGSFEQYRKSYSGEIIITAAQGRDYIENSQELITFIAHHPQVTSYSARYGVGIQLLGTLNDNPEKNERANRVSGRLVGIDPAKEEATTGFSEYIKYGSNLDPNEEGYILIGATLLKKYSTYADANIPGFDFLDNVDVGSRVRVTIPSKGNDATVKRGRSISSSSEGGDGVVKEFIVKGIVKSKVDEISTRMFVLDKELRRLLPVNKEQYQEIAIRTDYASAPALASTIKGFMGSYAVRVQTSDEAIPSFLRDIETTMGVLGNALSSIALVVASITIFIVVFINAITKRKFIGIMKGIGIKPLAVELSYVFQAIFYGLAGSVLGLLLTFGMLKPYFAANPIDFPFSDGILVVTPWSAGIRVTILILVTILAGFIPAKLIVRKNTLDSILGR